MDRSKAIAHIDRLRVFQLWLAAIALVVMMMVTLFDVFLRYAFNSPIRASYDTVEAMLVIFVFNGMSTAFLNRRGIVIDIIDNFVHRRVVVVLIRMADLLTIASLALYLYAMIKPAMQAYSYGDLKMELQVPVWWLWAFALAGLVGAIACAVGALITPPDPTHHDELI